MKYVFLGFILFLFTTAHASVRINEIAWSGTPASINDEWIELFNGGMDTVSLENWTLVSADGAPSILLTGTIDSGGFFLLERTDDTTVPNIEADQIYTGSLSNTGEELILTDAENNEIQRTPVEMWDAGESNPDRRSMMWIENGWQTFEGDANNGVFGTPGSENIVPLPGESFVSSPPTNVVITEIAPVSVGESEWLEIEVFSDYAIDLQNWKLRRGSSEALFPTLILTNGGQSLAEQTVDLLETGLVGQDQLNGSEYTFDEGAFVWLADDEFTPLRFIGNPSPIGLPDDGGVLEILNENDEIMTTALWEETRKGAISGVDWGEIWNWGILKYWPWRSEENSPTHTRGETNKIAPVFPEQLTMRIDEIAPNKSDGTDFIELLVINIPNDMKLPPWNIKHNGTELFSSEGEILESGERITLYFTSEKISEDPVRWLNHTTSTKSNTVKTWESSTKNGLNKTSGTLELNIWTGTSWEQTEDFVCWVKDELSETEQARVENHPNDWSGECFQNPNLLSNESIARPVQGNDTNTDSDFFHHFNGSPAQENTSQNQPPIPKILIQGGKKLYETSLNLTGLDGENGTTDPNGIHDIKSWKWEIDGKNCGNYPTDHWEWSNVRKGIKTCEEESSRDNPGLIYFNFNIKEIFDVTLTVEDYSGAITSITLPLNRDPFNVGGGGGSVFSAPLKKWLSKELGKESTSQKMANKIGGTDLMHETFFDEFIAQLDYTLIDPRTFKPNIPPKPVPIRFIRERVPQTMLPKVRKNIGIIFLY